MGLSIQILLKRNKGMLSICQEHQAGNAVVLSNFRGCNANSSNQEQHVFVPDHYNIIFFLGTWILSLLVEQQIQLIKKMILFALIQSL